MLGDLNGKPVLASETRALDMVGASFVRDIEHGEMVVISQRRHRDRCGPSRPPRRRPCVFEYVYFAMPDSVVNGRSVYDVRKRMGRRLAEESRVHADVVVPVPDSGVPAALGYAQAARPALRDGHHPQPLRRAAPSSSPPRTPASSACA